MTVTDPFARISALEAQIKSLTEALSNKETDLSTSRKEVRRHQMTGKSVEGVVRTTTHLLVPQHLVRGNFADYQRFRAMAQEDGLELRIASDAPFKDAKPMPERYENDRAIYIARPVLNGDGAKYREERAVAERNGKRLIVCNTSSEFPIAAFEGDK